MSDPASRRAAAGVKGGCYPKPRMNFGHEVSLSTTSSEELFIPVFDTINWLDTILENKDVQQLMAADFASAFRFVRGRVHHRCGPTRWSFATTSYLRDPS
jgi:hypothetical protein